ncbi:MAG: ankyrin repeat domain-containing protein [Elusimicrobiales bacterium]|nr:ankyrin repeat domain-containing protein [Elusimicrobiales bacterium]
MFKRVIVLLTLPLIAGCSAPALYRASGQNNTTLMAELLKQGADPNKRASHTYHLETPLHSAAYFGAVDAARLLIEHGADVNARAYLGATPLHFAAGMGRTRMVQFLLEKGADPEPGPAQWLELQGKIEAGTPLALAEKYGHSITADLIKDTIKAKLGITAGAEAVYEQYAPLVSALLKDYAGEGKTIAVAGFSYSDGRGSTDGNIVAGRFTNELIRLKKLKVVERDQIERVLSELKLQNAGAIGPESAKSIGRMLGADLLVIGGMVQLPGAVLELNVRLAEVESGQAVGAASGRVPRDWVN